MSSDLKVEEIRALLSDGWTANSEQVGYLLTKLDEAEKENTKLRSKPWKVIPRYDMVPEDFYSPDDVIALVAERDTKIEDAEERERVLIAGIRDALKVCDTPRADPVRPLVPVLVARILSRLLQEGKK